ncbi:MAG: zinc ribbon domain-containing protein [Prevotella sp.]|nr:zinc ribbon domain-containing protein [Prevotella sp.]
MAIIKCKHCGEEISDSIIKCPYCGERLNQNVSEPVKEKTFSTTDTGNNNEGILYRYADVILVLSYVLGIFLMIMGLSGMIVSNGNSEAIGMSLLIIIYGILTIFIGYVVKALIKVFANISINLRELNLKTK